MVDDRRRMTRFDRNSADRPRSRAKLLRHEATAWSDCVHRGWRPLVRVTVTIPFLADDDDVWASTWVERLRCGGSAGNPYVGVAIERRADD